MRRETNFLRGNMTAWRNIAFILVVLIASVRTVAQSVTWTSPDPGGFCNYTVNRIDASSVTITLGICRINDGRNCSMGINYLGQGFSGGVPRIGQGQTSMPIHVPSTLYFQAVHYVDNIAFDYIETGSTAVPIGPINSGSAAAFQLSLIDRNHIHGNYGDPIQLATGAEDINRSLFTFHGARDWKFALHYNSILAGGSIFGGWTSDFEAKITPPDPWGNILLNWDPNRSCVFMPVANQSGTYTSGDDSARYDTLYAQPGVGWLLVRKDQSRKVFNLAGQLIQDIDPHGRILQLSYSGTHLSGIVEPVSHTSVSFTYNGDNAVNTITDSNGATVSFTYTLYNGQSVGSIESITDQNGHHISFSYDEKNELLTETDSAGNTVLENTYDIFGCIVQQIGGNGVSGTIMRAESGMLPGILITNVSVLDRAGRNADYSYDGNYNLLSQNGLGPMQVFTYDLNNQMTSGGYLGNISQYAYDGMGNLVSSTDPLGNTILYTYDSRNNLLTITDAASRTTTLTNDSNNNILSLTNAAGGTTSWTYDGNSLPLTKALPGGGVYHYVYSNGLLSQVTDPDGVVERFWYDLDGRVVSHMDGQGNQSVFSYDDVGNKVSETNPLEQTISYVYDYRNRITTMTSPTGATTTFTYDNDSNLLTRTDALGNITTYSYDNDDQLLSSTDALGRKTNYVVDAEGKIISVTDPLGHTTTYGYDGADRLAAIVDAMGGRNSIAYDARGLPTGFTDPLNRTRTTSYDNVGRKLTSVDPIARTTQFVYDALNRLSQVTDPGGLIVGQGFDGDSNRTTATDPKSNTTSFTFDTGDRMVQMSTAGGRSSAITYNSRGLPQTATLPSGHSTTYSYDSAARVSSILDGVGLQTYTRDGDGRILTITENSKTLTRVYDRRGHVTSFVDGSGNAIGYQYDAAGQLTKLTYPGGNVVNYAYDPAGNLSTVTDWGYRITSFGYDPDNRLTQVTRPNGTVQKRGYDAAGQLVLLTELAADGVTVIYSQTGVFDAAGQLTSENTMPASVASPPNAAQTFDSDNRLLTHNGAATTFDADGNLLAIASGVTPASFTYDARSRLIAADSTMYSYDAEGRRVAVADGTGTTTFALNPNAMLDQVLVRTGPDGTQTYYVYGIGLLYEVSGSLVHYYHTNRRGDTVALTDSTGNVTDTTSYDAYGALVSHIGTTNTPFLFGGLWGVQTDNSGMYYCRARYYHPVLRRWLSRDPSGEAGGLNLYGYVFNNPISYIDPLGLAVYVGEHGALFDSDPLQHTAIVLRPDNPADFSGNWLFTNPTQATLGGQPGPLIQDPNAGNFDMQNLVSAFNYPRDNPGSECHPGRLKNLTLVPTPPGMTDTQFIQALISAAGSYQDNLRYALFPQGNTYNSNGYVSGVIIAAGGTPPSLPGIQPGYSHPIPLR